MEGSPHAVRTSGLRGAASLGATSNRRNLELAGVAAQSRKLPGGVGSTPAPPMQSPLQKAASIAASPGAGDPMNPSASLRSQRSTAAAVTTASAVDAPVTDETEEGGGDFEDGGDEGTQPPDAPSPIPAPSASPKRQVRSQAPATKKPPAASGGAAAGVRGRSTGPAAKAQARPRGVGLLHVPTAALAVADEQLGPHGSSRAVDAANAALAAGAAAIAAVREGG